MCITVRQQHHFSLFPENLRNIPCTVTFPIPSASLLHTQWSVLCSYICSSFFSLLSIYPSYSCFPFPLPQSCCSAFFTSASLLLAPDYQTQFDLSLLFIQPCSFSSYLCTSYLLTSYFSLPSLPSAPCLRIPNCMLNFIFHIKPPLLLLLLFSLKITIIVSY